MRYILLDPNDRTKIVGHFANPQPHLGTIEVADDDIRIRAWVAERKRLKQEGLERSAQQRGLLEHVAALESVLAEALARIAELERKLS